jgi:hypothetical protein
VSKPTFYLIKTSWRVLKRALRTDSLVGRDSTCASQGNPSKNSMAAMESRPTHGYPSNSLVGQAFLPDPQESHFKNRLH